MEQEPVPLNRRQQYLPQTPDQVANYQQAVKAGDKKRIEEYGPKPTSWEDASRKKTVFEQAVREYDKAQKKLAKDREILDQAALAYFQSIPITDSTLYSECPFSQRRIDSHMARNMYKLSEDLFRWIAPRTFQSVTEIKPFLDEMLSAAEWGMKMKVIEDALKGKDKAKIGKETQEEIF